MIGETGIAMDLNGKAAFRPRPRPQRAGGGRLEDTAAAGRRAEAGGDGDWSMHIAALDNIMAALVSLFLCCCCGCICRCINARCSGERPI